MNAFPFRSPWWSLALATLVAVWSGTGAFVQHEAVKQDRTLFVEAAEKAETAEQERDFGPTDGFSLAAAAPALALIRHVDRTLDPPSAPEPRRPLRHLLCVYRL